MRIDPPELWLLGAILLFALIVRLGLIDRPFHRDAEGCGSFYGMLARNYWRYDLAQTFGVPVMSMGQHAHPTFYPNHPPLVPVLVAAVFGVAGYTDYVGGAFPPDWLVRLPTVMFTLGCILLVYLLLRSTASPRAALLAAALFAAMPMTILFGGLVDVVGTQLDFFILLTIAAYLRFHERPSARWLTLMSLPFLAAALTDWPAFFLVPVVAVHFLLTRPARQWPWLVAFGVVATLCFLIPYAQVVLVTQDWLWMKELLRRRTISNVSDAQTAFTFGDWIVGAVYRHAICRHTWPVMILGTGWLIWAIARWRQPVPGVRVTGIVLAWAFLHIAVGRQGVFVHDWWWWPLTPGIAMAAGLALDALCRWYELPRRGLIDLRPVYTTVILFMALLAFAGWNTFATVRELRRHKGIVPHLPELDYTVVEIGQVIRDAAPPNAVVMLAESDASLALWYYADRPLRMYIWDPYTFEQRLRDGSSDLCYHVVERFSAPPVAFVFPTGYRAPRMEPLFQHLVSRYPMRQTSKFYVFDLMNTGDPAR